MRLRTNQTNSPAIRTKGKATRGFALAEAVVSLLIAGIAIAAMMGGFYSLQRSAEAGAYSLGANALALQTYERIRAAKWDALATPPVDEVVNSNFPPTALVLDVAAGGTNVAWATNFTTITMISTNPLLKAVRVDCVYRVGNSGLITNSITSFRAAECGQQNAQPNTAPPVEIPPPPTGTLATTNVRSAAVEEQNTWTSGSDGRSRYGRSGSSSSGSTRYRRSYNDDDDD
jgi:type II secretory pathway pseudopilin PulG